MSNSPVPMAGAPARPLGEDVIACYHSMSGPEAQAEWHRVMEESLRGGTMDPQVPERLRLLIDVCASRGVGVIPR